MIIEVKIYSELDVIQTIEVEIPDDIEGDDEIHDAAFNAVTHSLDWTWEVVE